MGNRSRKDRSLFSSRALSAALLLVLAAATVLAPPGSRAEADVRTGPHPLGTLTVVGNDPQCDTDAGKTRAGVPPDSSCASFKVSCPNGSATLPDRNGFYAVSRATGSVALRGMIVMFSGGPGTNYWGWGTEFDTNPDGTPKTPAYHFITDLRAAGFDVVQIRWADSWAASGEGIDAGAHVACRPATAIDWVKRNLYVPIPHADGVCGFCTLGSSGGSAQVTWPLSHFGAAGLVADAPLVDAVFATGGPTHSALTKGCLRQGEYAYGDGSSLRQIDGIFGYTSRNEASPWFRDDGPCVTSNGTQSWIDKWNMAAIATGGDNYSYPKTRVHIVVGERDTTMRHHSLDFAVRAWNAGSPMFGRQVVSGMGHDVSLSTAGMAALEAAVVSTTSPETRALTVTIPSSSGSVSSEDLQITCPRFCSAGYALNEQVTLTATPDPGFAFTGWTGACTNTSGTCTVTMSSNASVAATFGPAGPLVALTVQPDGGDGSGFVSSDKGGISCPGSCSAQFASGEVVELVASASSTSRFTGWDGCDVENDIRCTVTMTDARTVTATFEALATATLTITPSPVDGTVTSPEGIACPDDCEETFVQSPTKTVTLTANPASGFVFQAWTGDCSAVTQPECTVTMDMSRSAGATFAAVPTHQLTVTRNDPGAGTVTSSPDGIDCGSTCSSWFNEGTDVALTPTPSPGWQFTSWTGCTSESGTVCTVNMSEPKSVTATFTAAPGHTLTVSRSGSGTGTVTSAPAGIDCGSDCTETYAASPSVTLTAAPATGSAFIQWFGACSGSSATCTVTMSEARSVEAVFNTGGVHGVTVSSTSYTPRSLNGVMGNTVLWTFATTTNQSVTDVKNLGNTGSSANAWYDSGLRTSGVFAHQFPAAGLYSYRTNGGPFTGSVTIPMVATTPTTGTTTTSFGLKWSAASMPGHAFLVQYEFKPTGGTRFGKAKTLGGQAQMLPSGTFVPDQGKGVYRFKITLQNLTTGVLGGPSPWLLLSVN